MTKTVHEDDHLSILQYSSGALLALSKGALEPGWKRTTHFGFQLETADAL